MKGSINKKRVRFKKNTEFEPIRRFHLFLKFEFNKIKKILIEIQSLEDDGTDLIIKNALIEYVIIKTVSIFEYFFKSLAHKLGSNISVELDKVLRKGYEENRSKALVDSFTYSNPKVVVEMYKQLLNRDIIQDAETYFDGFNNQGVEHEIYHIRRIPLLSKNWNNFYKLFEYRNRIIHKRFSPSTRYSELRKMVGAVFDVMAVSQQHGY